MIEPPSYARPMAAGMALAAAVGLALNHFVADLGMANLLILALCPIALALGIGGLVEPKVLWSMGKHGENLPVEYKVIGGVLGAAGLLLGLALIFVYRARFGW
jgi:hypothetical protein